MICSDRHNSLPELLSPAGTLAHLKAAVRAGADAVYIGGDRFGARAYAGNFDEKDLLSGLSYAHFYGKKVYLTVNTLMKERELREELYDFLLPYEEAGLDGVIVQDLGAASFIHEAFPCLEVHASTQMTILDTYGALAAKKLGMTRVVPARELSLDEIRKIKAESGLEVEVFIHGALCYCYSGQCLMSSIAGGRSGNRGRCAQPCRLPYQTGLKDFSKETGPYLLSPKDLCSISMLPALVRAGIDSLKIEGRMKNEFYVAGVTAIYRKYLDHWEDFSDQSGLLIPEPGDLHDLEELYCRDGFTDGYWNRHNGAAMMTTRLPRNTGHVVGRVASILKGRLDIEKKETLYPGDVLMIPTKNHKEVILTVPRNMEDLETKTGHVLLKAADTGSVKRGEKVYRRRKEALISRISDLYLKEDPKRPVTGKISLRLGCPVRLTLSCGEDHMDLEGPVPEPAAKQSIREEDIRRQFDKTGSVPFSLTRFDICLEEGLFVAMSALKNFRQKAYQELIRTISRRDQRPAGIRPVFPQGGKTMPDQSAPVPLNLTVYSKDQLYACLSDPFTKALTLPEGLIEDKALLLMRKAVHKAGKKCYLWPERIIRSRKDQKVSPSSPDGFDGVYVHTIGQIYSMADRFPHIPVRTGPSLYQWNSRAFKTVAGLHPAIASVEAPLELSGKELVELYKVLYNASGKNPERELLLYGRYPVMISAQCLKASCQACNHRQETLYIYNSKKERYPVTTHCGTCANTIWSPERRDLIGEDLTEIHPYINCFHIDLFGVGEEEISGILSRYHSWSGDGYRLCENSSDRYWHQGTE